MKAFVENLKSPRSGSAVANQFKICVYSESGDGMYETFFQSYKTVIARYSSDGLTLDPNWDYSRTTNRYLYQFTGLSRKEIEAGIKSGSIKVEDLNK